MSNPERDHPETTKRRRWPHILWRGKAVMTFPKVTRDVTHFGIVWGPWFFGFAIGGKPRAR